MGYYVKADYSGYYEGEKEEETDIEVTERPAPPCEWDGAAWTYPLLACQVYQYGVITAAMSSNLSSLLASFNSSIYELIVSLYLAQEALRYTYDPSLTAADVPSLEQYRTDRSIGTLADAAAEVMLAGGRGGMTIGAGKINAQLDTLHAQILADVDGATVLTRNWVDI